MHAAFGWLSPKWSSPGIAPGHSLCGPGRVMHKTTRYAGTHDFASLDLESNRAAHPCLKFFALSLSLPKYHIGAVLPTTSSLLAIVSIGAGGVIAVFVGAMKTAVPNTRLGFPPVFHVRIQLQNKNYIKSFHYSSIFISWFHNGAELQNEISTSHYKTSILFHVSSPLIKPSHHCMLDEPAIYGFIIQS